MDSAILGTAGAYLAVVVLAIGTGCITCNCCGIASPQNLAGDAALLVGVILQTSMYGVADGDTTGIITSLIVLLAFFSLIYAAKFLFLVREHRKTLWVLLGCRVVTAVLIVYALFPGTTPEQTILNAEPGVLIFLVLGFALMLVVSCFET